PMIRIVWPASARTASRMHSEVRETDGSAAPRTASRPAGRLATWGPTPTSEQLSAVLSEPLPHRALAILTGDCSRSPMRKVGERGVGDRISSAELGRLAGGVDIGVPRFETALVGGENAPYCPWPPRRTGPPVRC